MKLVFDRYIANDPLRDAYHERFNEMIRSGASPGRLVEGRQFRVWSPAYQVESESEDRVALRFGDITVSFSKKTGNAKFLSCITTADYLQTTGPLTAEECAEHVIGIYKMLGGAANLAVVRTEIDKINDPYQAYVRLGHKDVLTGYAIDSGVEAYVDLRTGLPSTMWISEPPELTQPQGKIIPQDQAVGAAAEAVYRHLGWADVEIGFHPPTFMIPDLGGYANELREEDILLTQAKTAKLLYFGTISQPRPWGRAELPTNAWCLVWVDAESGRVLVLAPSSRHIVNADIQPAAPSKKFTWSGVWRTANGEGTLTPTVLGRFDSGKKVILQQGPHGLAVEFDAASGLVRAEVSGSIHYAKPDASLRRALESSPEISERRFGGR